MKKLLMVILCIVAQNQFCEDFVGKWELTTFLGQWVDGGKIAEIGFRYPNYLSIFTDLLPALTSIHFLDQYSVVVTADEWQDRGSYTITPLEALFKEHGAPMAEYVAGRFRIVLNLEQEGEVYFVLEEAQREGAYFFSYMLTYKTSAPPQVGVRINYIGEMARP